MKRHVLGILAATVAAPYSVVVLKILAVDLVENGVSEFLKAIPIGTLGLFFVGPPLLLISMVLALILNAAGFRSWPAFAFSGALVGLSTLAFDSSPSKSVTVVSTLSGAICGWIYWRIAVHRPASPAGGSRQEIREP